MDASSYHIDVRPILEDLGGTVPVDALLTVPPLVVGSERFVPRGPAHLLATLTNTGAGIVASGTVSVEVTATCSRCLAEFPLLLEGEVEGFFVHHGREAELPEEQEHSFIDDATVDLMPAIEAALAVDAPFAPLHDPACKGICPTCGADLNEGACGCAPAETASPFSVLRTLLGEDEADGS